MYKLEIQSSEKLHSKYGIANIVNFNGLNYYRISSTKEGNYKRLFHRVIFEEFYGKIPNDCAIHHKDGNSLNNCLMNLQILPYKEHSKLHKPSIETKIKMSKSRNSTGFFNVHKSVNKDCKQGFTWVYGYSEDGKRKSISRTDLKGLEKAVKGKGLRWYKFENTL